MVMPARSGFRASNGALSRVTTAWTGPRRANSATSGVVSTTSPRNEVWTTRENCTPRALFHLQHRQKRFLRDLDRAHLLHPLLSLLLLLEELALPRDVAAVALREHVLAERFHRRARDHLVPDRRLNRNLEELPRDQLPQLVGNL